MTRRVTTWCSALLLAALLFCPWLHAGDVAVGKVIFVSGEVFVEREGGRTGLGLGDPVFASDRLATQADAHLHIRFVDDGLISLRPSSRAVVDVYQYDSGRPESSKVRISLEEGVLRSATGKGGEANRDGFRINTPIAAIGIRGTDFVIYADANVVRLMVNAGGVVMAPFGDYCQAAAFNPCSGDSSAELFASVSKALLEARAGQDYALVTTEGPLPDDIRPPHPEEAQLFEAVIATTRKVLGDHYGVGLSAPGAESYEDGLEKARRYVQEVNLVQEAFALGELESSQPIARDRGLVDRPQIVWGRWTTLPSIQGGLAEQRSIQQKARGRDPVRMNQYYGMYMDGTQPMPDAGKVSFKLNSYDAMIVRDGGSLSASSFEAASVSNSSLVVDFDTSMFATRLDIHADSLPGPVHVLGAGQLKLNDDGLALGSFNSDGSSLAKIEGVLSPGAAEAGYLFEYQVSPGVNAVGATHWINNGALGADLLNSLRY